MGRLLQRNCTKDEFFLLFFKLLKERFPELSIEFSDDDALSVSRDTGGKSTLYLGNLWTRYDSNNEDRRELIENFLSLACDLADAPSIPNRENIVAIVRDSQYAADPKLMKEHLCGDLWVVYAVDLPTQISTLTRDQMRSAGVSEGELRELAIKHLKQIVSTVEQEGEGPWYQLKTGDGYEASLLLFEDMWDNIAKSLKGNPVVAIPSRNTLLYTDSHSPEGINAIRGLSEKISRSEPYTVSETLIVRTAGKWAVFHAH